MFLTSTPVFFYDLSVWQQHLELETVIFFSPTFYISFFFPFVSEFLPRLNPVSGCVLAVRAPPKSKARMWSVRDVATNHLFARDAPGLGTKIWGPENLSVLGEPGQAVPLGGLSYMCFTVANSTQCRESQVIVSTTLLMPVLNPPHISSSSSPL